MRCWRFVIIAILFLDFFKAEAQSDQLLVDFQLFRDSVFSGMKTNRAYDKLRAAEIMELFLKEKKYPLSDREEAFQIWTELTHFGKRHQQLKDLGPGYLSLFGESGRYDQLEAEFAYFRFYTESFFSKITDLSQLEKIVTRLSLFPGSRRTYSLALDRLGRVYFDHNRYQEALEKLQQANQIFIQNNHLLVASSNLTVQGVVYDAMEDYIASAQAYQHSNELLNQLDNKPFGTISANAYNLGLLYLDRLGDPERALPFFAEALENDRLDGGEDNFYLGDDYKMLSLAALKLGDLSLAESRARMSVSHFESIRQETSPQMATSKLQLALVLHARGKVDQAVALAEQALAILIDSENERKTDLRRPMAQTYNQLGYHQTTLGLWPEATESFAQAARLAKALGRDIFLLESLRGSLKLHLLMNQPDEARLAWLELQGILESKFAEAKVLRLEQQLNSLRIDFAKGYRPEQLLTSLDELILRASDLKAAGEVLFGALELKFKVLKVGDLELSQAEAKASVRHMIDLIRIIQQDRVGMINSAAVNQAIRPAVEESLGFLWSQSSERKDRELDFLALEVMELGKEIQLGRGEKKMSFSEPKKEQQWKETKQALAEVRVKIAQSHLGARSSSSDQRRDFLLEDSLQQVITMLELQHNSGTHPSQDLKGPLMGWLEDLPADVQLVEYFLGEEQIFLWSYSAGQTWFGKLSDPDLKIQSLRQFVHAIRSQRQKSSLPELNLQDWIPWQTSDVKHLLIIPDGVLAQVPFELFRVENDWAISTLSISYLPNIQSAIAGKSSKAGVWKGFAPDYLKLRLPGNEQEVSRIGALMDGEVFVAQQAKKSYFLKEASSAGFLHLAVHGELDASSPSYSRLWFGDEESEALTALEIYDLSLQAQLAVLSACNSGLGDPLFGNGLLSLAQAFRMAGIGSTVMSLWEVPDRESAAIMEYFYHHLKSGLSKDEALRQAKLTYLENQNDPALQHPFYWAGFVVLGDYDPVSSSPWWYWGIVLFLFGGGAFLLWIPISKWYSLKYRSGEN